MTWCFAIICTTPSGVILVNRCGLISLWQVKVNKDSKRFFVVCTELLASVQKPYSYIHVSRIFSLSISDYLAWHNRAIVLSLCLT